MEYEKRQKKKWTAKILRNRWLLRLAWCVLTVVLSTFGILYQVAKSIPDSLQAGKILSLALQACIGATQGLVGSFIIPHLAGKITRQKHVLTTVSGLLMNCMIPIVVIIYLDTGLHCEAIIRRKPRGDGGKGTGKKRHDNLRQTSRQFMTFYDNLQHFMTFSVSLFH